MNPKPKYLLKYGDKEIEDNDLDEIMRVVKTLTVYYEIFRVYKSATKLEDRTKSILTIRNIEEAKRLHAKGYSNAVISRQLDLGRHYIEKIIGVNAIV
jgi:hypothetical protein